MFYADDRKQDGGSMTTAEAGRMGGEAVVEKYGPEHMAEIGRKGGEAVSQDREHMSEIGRKGGEARGGSDTGNE